MSPTNTVAGAPAADIGRDPARWLAVAQDGGGGTRRAGGPAHGRAAAGRRRRRRHEPARRGPAARHGAVAGALAAPAEGRRERRDRRPRRWATGRRACCARSGPYPALRVGDVPYGVLPAVDLSTWRAGAERPVFEEHACSRSSPASSARPGRRRASRAGPPPARTSTACSRSSAGCRPRRAPGLAAAPAPRARRAPPGGGARQGPAGHDRTSGRRRRRGARQELPAPLRRYQAFGYVQPAVRGHGGVRDAARGLPADVVGEARLRRHEVADPAPFLVRLLRHSLLLRRPRCPGSTRTTGPPGRRAYLLSPNAAPEQLADRRRHGGRVDQLPALRAGEARRAVPAGSPGARDRPAVPRRATGRARARRPGRRAARGRVARARGRGGAGHVEPPDRPVDHGRRDPPPAPAHRPRSAAPARRVRLGRRPLACHRPDAADHRRAAPRAGDGAGARRRRAARPRRARRRRALADHRPLGPGAAGGEARSRRPARRPPQRGARPRDRAARRRPGRRPRPCAGSSRRGPSRPDAGSATGCRSSTPIRRRSAGGRPAGRPSPRARHLRRPARRRRRPRRRLRAGGAGAGVDGGRRGSRRPARSCGCSARSARAHLGAHHACWSPCRSVAAEPASPVATADPALAALLEAGDRPCDRLDLDAGGRRRSRWPTSAWTCRTWCSPPRRSWTHTRPRCSEARRPEEPRRPRRSGLDRLCSLLGAQRGRARRRGRPCRRRGRASRHGSPRSGPPRRR